MSHLDDAKHHRAEAAMALNDLRFYVRNSASPSAVFATLERVIHELEAAAVANVMHQLKRRAEELPDTAAKGALLALLEER